MKKECFKTKDGSNTIYLPEWNEFYHSIHGAIQESLHVFINAGLKQISTTECSVFEMGLGTGLNCLLTYLNIENKKIDYHAVELHPLEIDIIRTMDYDKSLELNQKQQDIYKQIHESSMDAEIRISDKMKLKKQKADIRFYHFIQRYDLVYYDAFAPSVQPELWTGDIFKNVFNSMNPNGILVTYCAKGQVRRDLQYAGFKVERLPGPPGKREMLRAKKVIKN